jgi:hypothetical protein
MSSLKHKSLFLPLLAAAVLLTVTTPAQARYTDGMNVYAYVDSSPTGSLDPYGLLTKKQVTFNPVVITQGWYNATDKKGGKGDYLESGYGKTLAGYTVKVTCKCDSSATGPHSNPWQLETVDLTLTLSMLLNPTKFAADAGKRTKRLRALRRVRRNRVRSGRSVAALDREIARRERIIELGMNGVYGHEQRHYQALKKAAKDKKTDVEDALMKAEAGGKTEKICKNKGLESAKKKVKGVMDAIANTGYGHADDSTTDRRTEGTRHPNDRTAYPEDGEHPMPNEPNTGTSTDVREGTQEAGETTFTDLPPK